MSDRILLRPKGESDGSETRILGLHLPVRYHLALEQLARQTGRTKTEILEMAISEFLKRVEIEPAPQE